MPVSSTLQADYELNPYRRRGGEERVPTPQASVVRTHVMHLRRGLLKSKHTFSTKMSVCDQDTCASLSLLNNMLVCRTIGCGGPRLAQPACKATLWQMLSLAVCLVASA